MMFCNTFIHFIMLFNTPATQAPLPFQAAIDYAALVTDWATAASSDGMTITRNVAYGTDTANTYDVFAPEHCTNAPILIFWHGGGWANGYKHWVYFMAQHVTQRGFVLCVPAYRLAPEYRLNVAFDDAVQALKHIVGHAAQHGGDASRIVLAGHSAGGHLAALLALRSDALAQAGVKPAQIKACLPISAIMDLHHPAPAAGSLEERVYTTVLEIGRASCRERV